MAAERDNTPGTPRAVTAPTRREALTAIGATALAGINVAAFARPESTATLADAALLAACARHQQAEGRLTALVRDHSARYGFEMPEAAYEEQGLLCDAINEHVEAVRDLPAITSAGLRAKAEVLWAEEGWLAGREPDTLLFSLLRDLRSGLTT